MVKRILALTLTFILSAVFLTSCSGNIDGTYTTRETLIDSSVTFNDGKITMSTLGININGTYKIKGGEITITSNLLGEETSQTMTFKKDGKSIFIDGTEYIKD